VDPGREAAAVLVPLSGRVYGDGATTGGREEIVISHGAGSRVFDTKGREYVDFLLGSGPLILGHAPPSVTKAVAQQLARGSTFYAATPAALILAQEVCRAVPCAERIVYAMTGSDAITMAIRVARAHTGRRLLLAFEGAYHGWHDSVLQGRAGEGTSASLATGISPATAAELVVAGFNDLSSVRDLLERYGEDVAAVLVEPIHRYIPPAPGFLDGLRELTRRCGAVLIFDEVVTSFRLAYGGAQEYYGVVPDLAAVGKALGGGYPIAALCGRAKLFEACGGPESGARVRFGGTFNGYAIGVAAALATLEELRREGVYPQLHALGRKARTRLAEVFARHAEPCQVLGEGPMLGLVFQAEPVTDYRSSRRGDAERARRFRAALLEAGIFVNVAGSKLYLSLVHSEDDVERLAEAADRALGMIREPAVQRR
jgi:glutamate-1-semialdehyde 2,1-aminomutase